MVIVKQAFSFFAMLPNCALLVQILHWNCNLYTAGKVSFAVQKLQCFGYFWLHLGAVFFRALELQKATVQNRKDVLGSRVCAH